MKKLVFVLIAFLCVELSAQRVKYDTLLTVTAAIDDTVLLVPMKKADGRYVQIDINTLDADTDTIDAGPALDGDSFQSFGTVGTVDLPCVANKANFRLYDAEVTYKARIGIWEAEAFPAKYLWIRYKRVDSTEGYIVVVYL